LALPPFPGRTPCGCSGLLSQRLDEDDKALQAHAEICAQIREARQHFDVEVLELQDKRLAWACSPISVLVLATRMTGLALVMDEGRTNKQKKVDGRGSVVDVLVQVLSCRAPATQTQRRQPQPRQPFPSFWLAGSPVPVPTPANRQPAHLTLAALLIGFGG